MISDLAALVAWVEANRGRPGMLPEMVRRFATIGQRLRSQRPDSVVECSKRPWYREFRRIG